MSSTDGGNAASPKRVSKAEVSRVLKDGLHQNNGLRVHGLTGLSSFRRSKAKMQTREQTRLTAKYDKQDTRVKSLEARLSANVETISGLRMEVNRASEVKEVCDARTWTVKGRVYDRKGCPVAGAQIAVYDQTGKRVEQVEPTQSDKQGRYKIDYSTSKERIDQLLTQDEQALSGEGSTHLEQGDQGSDTLTVNSGLQINTDIDNNSNSRENTAHLRVNTKRDSAVFVRALAEQQDNKGEPLCADSTLMEAKVGNCNYRDLILDTDRAAGLVSDIAKNRRASRYLGNSATRELHDLKNEKGNCQVDEMRADHCVRFKSVKEGESFGYDFCAYCFGKAKSQR